MARKIRFAQPSLFPEPAPPLREPATHACCVCGAPASFGSSAGVRSGPGTRWFCYPHSEFKLGRNNGPGAASEGSQVGQDQKNIERRSTSVSEPGTAIPENMEAA